MRAGAIPVLADIEPDSGLLAIESARRCVSPRTRAIVLVHLYGQVRDMDGWKDLCREHAIELIEDCAQSHLSCWDRSEEHTSELQSLMRISYAVFCLNKKTTSKDI